MSVSEKSFPRIRQTVIDTADPRRLAEFYRQLLGLVYRDGDEPRPDEEPREWLVLREVSGSSRLAFQHVAGLPRPSWPDGDPPQMMHLDLAVPDSGALVEQKARAEALGASVILDRSDDPDEPLYVFADPSGHPFCIFVAGA